VQSDGKIILAGKGSNDFALVRYNTDGSLDTSFDSDGVATTGIGAGTDVGFSVQLQSDDKIVVAGFSHNGSNYDFAVARFDANGSLDTGFGGDGTVTTAVGTGDDSGYGVVIQNDGKIVVGGESWNGSAWDFALVRYDTDGTLDATFDSVNTLDGTPSFIEGGAAVVLDSDVNVSDAELDALNGGVGNYDGASLTLVRNGGASSEDVFSETGTLSALTESGNVVVGGTIIGTVTTNSGGTLLLTFNTDATTARVNSALQQIAYSNSSDTPPATAQIDWSFDDGNTGSQGTGGALQAVGSTTVTITQINDDPTNAGSLPTDISVTEDVASNVDLSAIDLSDVDAAGGSLTVTLTTSTGGNLTAAAGTGITIGGTSTARTLTGTLTDLNNYLNTASNITYLHGTTNTNGDNADTIQINVNDNGNTGGSGTDIDLGTTNVDISAVNDLPTAANNTVTTNEDTTYTFTAADFNYSDLDLDVMASVEITTLETAGALQLSGVDVTLNQVISKADIDAGNVKFVPVTDANGTSYDSFAFSVNDGTADSASSYTMTVDVTAYNDAPVVNAPGAALAATEQVGLAIHGSGFSVSDVDEAGSGATATLSVGEGAITVAVGDSGATISSGNGTGSVVVTGTIAQLNTLLTAGGTGTITYLNGSDTPSASTTFTVTVNDTGNTGTDPGLTGDGTSEEGTNSQTINLTATNDDPTFLSSSGTPDFTLHTITTAADGAYSVSTADVDGDGDLDVLSASFIDDKIAWYENDGAENFTAHTITTAADAAYSVTTADVDGDGDLDVLSASYSDDKIAWYENDGAGNFT
ncbi:MAG: hypothetical protein GY926_00480, partial [bacterium]|nr:hypothetical protein [bacterium]